MTVSASSFVGRPLIGFAEPERQAALDWLLAACRRWLATDGGAPPPRQPTPPIAALGRMAFCHNLEPLLHRLVARGELHCPAAVLEEEWRKAYYRSLARNSSILDALTELLDGCRRAGVEVVVLKGLATAATAYGDLALREMSDVDLLCRERDLASLCRVAGELGYRSGGEETPYNLRILHPDLGVPFEVHYDAYELIANRDRFLERAWASPAQVELDGRLLPVLGPESAVVFSLAHLVNHDFKVNLRSCLDMAGLLAGVSTTPDAGRLRRELAAVELEDEMGLLLDLLRRLLGFTPPTAGVGVPPPARARELRRTVGWRLLNVEEGSRQAAFAGTRARPWRDRPRYLLRLLVPPASHFRALRQLRPGGSAGYLSHLFTTLRRGWRSLRRRGGEPAVGDATPKRRAHQRRSRR